jgi:lipoate-protein ligase B
MQFWSLKTQYEDPRLARTVSYAQAWEFQQKCLELRAADEIPDTVLFAEHAPVITRGRGLQFTGAPRPRHMPVPANLPEGFEFAESERGGDLTYHGPGQLVIYPIFKLDGSSEHAPFHDIGAFLRRFERIIISEFTELGLAAESREHATGVWVGNRKLVSLGIAVRKWVTYHGAAINVVNDLKPYHLISPCGFDPEVMTRLSDLLPTCPEVQPSSDWRTYLENRLARRWESGAQVISQVLPGRCD